MLGIDDGKLTNKQEYLESVKNKVGIHCAQTSDSRDSYIKMENLTGQRYMRIQIIPSLLMQVVGVENF